MNAALAQAVAKTRLASLLTIFLFFTASFALIKGEDSFLSPSAVAGYIFLAIGILMASISMYLYLLKEHTAGIAERYESIIKVQQNALEAKGRPYETLDNSSKTADSSLASAEESISIPSDESTPTSL